MLAVNEDATEFLPQEIKIRLLDDAVFWTNVDKIINILNPIVLWTTKVQNNECFIHLVYGALKEIETSLKESVSSNSDKRGCLLSKSEETTLISKLTSRISNSIKPIHYAAALLNPSTQGYTLSPAENIDAMEFIYTLAASMNLDSNAVMKDVANYKSKDGLWSKTFLWGTVKKVTPLTWWRGLCNTTILSEVAMKILSIPVSSAATERSFSSFSWIHNKRRNRLTRERAGKLTYIAHNWKLHNKNLEPEEPQLPEESFEDEPKLSTSKDIYNLSHLEDDSDSESDDDWIA